MSPDDDNVIGQNVIRLRKRRGLSPGELAKEVGVRLFTIQQIEKGHTRKSKFLPDIARVLRAPLSDIDPAQAESVSNVTFAPSEVVGPRDLPVYATTEAGEGTLVMSSDPVDRADRPASLAHVTDAYGVLVKGASMGAVVPAGSIVAVHPHAFPRREDICVFRRQVDGEFHSTVKEYVGSTADSWRVKRYKPEEKEFLLKKADWPECHVVVTIHRR